MENKKLLDIFEAEICTRIDRIELLLIEFSIDLEDKTKNKLINSLFLEFHSIKGAAHAAGAADLERICQATGDLLKSALNGKIKLISDNITLFNKVNNTLNQLMKVFLKETEESEVEYFNLLMQMKKISEGY